MFGLPRTNNNVIEIRTYVSNINGERITQHVTPNNSRTYYNHYGQPLMYKPDMKQFTLLSIQTNTTNGGVVYNTGNGSYYGTGGTAGPSSSHHIHDWKHDRATRQKSCLQCVSIEDDTESHDIPTCDCKLCSEDRAVFAELGIEGYDGRPFPPIPSDAQIHHLDSDGNTYHVDPDTYHVDPDTGWVVDEPAGGSRTLKDDLLDPSKKYEA